MMTSPTTLCLQCALQRAKKLTRHELAVASMQHMFREGNSLAFQERKLESVGDWWNGKGCISSYSVLFQSTVMSGLPETAFAGVQLRGT